MKKQKRIPVTEADKEGFLRKDLYYSLIYLFKGAIVWKAIEEGQTEKISHQQVFGMYTSLVQARLLYEFFSKEEGKSKDDDAIATDFSDEWNSQSPLCKDFLGYKSPGNKRLFHLVYHRSEHHGGEKDNDQTHLKKQVLKIAIELFNLMKEFIKNSHPQYKSILQEALDKAIEEAQKAADFYGIDNPFKI